MVNVNCDDKEWIRRRQMRIMQVRKQSNDIAKQLRERVVNEERERRCEEKRLLDRKLHVWKVKRLKNLEEMYRKAISDFGTGHKMATEKPNPAIEMKEKHEEYLSKAKERGESALELELKGKKEAAEKKQIPIQRKMITRKIEDLRSSLICSIPAKEPSLILRDIYAGKTFDPKKFENCEFKEHIKKNSKPEETIQKKEAQSVKNTSEGFATRKTGPAKRKTKKKIVNQIMPKSGVISDTRKEKTSKTESPRCENNWVNLGAIETLTKADGEEEEEEEETKNKRISNTNLIETESEKGSKKEKNAKEKEKVLKYEFMKKKITPVRQKPVIECHGASLRRNCKLKDTISVVQSPWNTSEPNAMELALKEEEKLLLERNEKETRENAAEERGNKALEKQKIIKNYNELLMKLEKLSTKEKLIKSYCHIPPAHLFFSDERRKEKSARKQRIMDSEFERIYYDVTGEKPDLHINTRLNLRPSIEEVKADSESGSVITKLDFSKLDSNLKTNSPASNSESKSQRKEETNRVSSPVEKVSIKKTPSSFHYKRTKLIKGDSKALLEIDRILKKCQELRQESRSDGDSIPNQPGPECSGKKADTNLETESISCKSTENGSTELQFCKSDISSPCEGKRVSDINDLKSSPRKNLSAKEKAVLEDLAMGDMPRNFVGIRNNVTAWPVHEINRTKPGKTCSRRSSSTSYRSLPPVIRPKGINDVLQILAFLKEREGKCTAADELLEELENLVSASVQDAVKNNVDVKEEGCQNAENNRGLSYYIPKLLDMSREKVADLSLSSESDTSIPKITAVCDKQADRSPERGENKYLKQIKDNSRVSRITRAKELEEIIKRWKSILEHNLNSCSIEDDFSQSDINENAAECTREEEDKKEEKYEDIAQICSDRMAVLSRVLANCINKGYVPKPEQECGQTQYEHDENNQGPANEGQNYIACPENKIPAVFSRPKIENKECPGSNKGSPRKKKLSRCDDRNCPYRVPLNDGNNVNCQANQPANISLESLPNAMEELLEKKIISSPFQWSKGNELSDYSAEGSCQSRKSKGGPIQVNKLPDKNEQECPKPKVKNYLYQPYKCKDSCKGSCATSANNIIGELKKCAKRAPVTEKIVQDNDPVCMRQFQTKTIDKPRRQGPMDYRDAVYGIFSPIPCYYKAGPKPKPADVTPEMYPAHPDELFKKNTFASRYVWDEGVGTLVVNPNGGVPVAHRPFWEPRDEIPQSPGIKITAVKRNPNGPPKRPSSSPVRGRVKNSGREVCNEPSTNPCKILHFEEDSYDPYYNVMGIKEPDNGLMEEWVRRNMVSNLFNRSAQDRDSCAGSCAVHCNSSYNSLKNRPRSSSPGGNYRVESYQRAANSSPDVRQFGRGPIQDAAFSPIRCQFEEEYEGEDDYEDSEDCEKYHDFNWAQNLLQDLNERNRL